MQLEVLQWNVWFKEDIDKVIGVIKELNPDIVCLQELTQGYHEQPRDNTWEHIKQELGYYGVHQTIPIITESDEWLQANAIFSRYPLHNPEEHWLHSPADLEDITDQFRGYLQADVEINGKKLTVGTTHMSFEEYEDDDEEGEESQSHISFGQEDDGADPELSKLLNVTRRQLGRYILTGDLNATPDSKRVRALSNRFTHAGPSFAEKTWTTKAHITDLFEASTLDWRYDYVFTTDDITVTKARIVETDVSDHLPILVSFKLPD